MNHVLEKGKDMNGKWAMVTTKSHKNDNNFTTSSK